MVLLPSYTTVGIGHPGPQNYHSSAYVCLLTISPSYGMYLDVSLTFSLNVNHKYMSVGKGLRHERSKDWLSHRIMEIPDASKISPSLGFWS